MEATMTTIWSVRCVPVEYRLTMIASVSGAVSDTTAKDDESGSRQSGLHLGRAFGERANAGVQRRGADQEVERGPSALQVARLVVVAAVESEPPVYRVGDEQRDDAREQQEERHVLLASPDREPDRAGDEHQVHQRIAHRHELLRGREGRVVGVRRDQEDPRQHAHADADDQRVDGSVAVAARVAMSDQQQDARGRGTGRRTGRRRRRSTGTATPLRRTVRSCT